MTGRNTDLLFHVLIHSWLTPVCALTGEGTRNLGVSGRCSNQLIYPARAALGLWTEVQTSHHVPLSPSPSPTQRKALTLQFCEDWEVRTLKEGWKQQGLRG